METTFIVFVVSFGLILATALTGLVFSILCFKRLKKQSALAVGGCKGCKSDDKAAAEHIKNEVGKLLQQFKTETKKDTDELKGKLEKLSNSVDFSDALLESQERLIEGVSKLTEEVGPTSRRHH